MENCDVTNYDLKYLKTLSKQYPTIASAATEIINLNAILSLPKGTEHFMTDIHGEYDQFSHVLRNGSGAIRRRIDDEFAGTLVLEEKKELATLIYYPERKLESVLRKKSSREEVEDWYKVTINRLVRMAKLSTSKYSRSKVRKSLPKDFAYVIEELLSDRNNMADQEDYQSSIVSTIVRIGRAQALIIALCNLIRRLVVDHIHIIGDIYDRGPEPHVVMEELMKHHSVDIQWGNHDVLWMGAAAGQTSCIATILRISAKYGNLSIVEDAYGINLLPLERFAMKVYEDDPCECFKNDNSEHGYDAREKKLDMKIHKAIAVIQFKLEGQLIQEHPEYHMEKRLLLDKMDLEKGTVTVEGIEYPLRDTNFPTIDPKNPYMLSEEEERIVRKLKSAFVKCEKLQRHIRFLYSNGSLYKVYNGNLLYHACVPLNPDGSLREVEIYGKKYKGKALYDVMDSYCRKAYFSDDPVEKKKGEDLLWFAWLHEDSPVFGKAKMTTFERYFIADKESHKEPKDPYYKCYENEEVVNSILEEFGLDPNTSHIINGHVPVESKKGESPIKCNGKLLAIDGGFSKVYQPKTGIAGYTLTYNSYGMILAAHEPFTSVEKAVKEGSDIHSHMVLVEQVVKRKRVGDTDTGKELKENIQDLEMLLQAYREGVISERE